MTRRDFMKLAACAAAGAALPWTVLADEQKTDIMTRVVLVRRNDAFDANGNLDPKIASKMLDDAVCALFDTEIPIKAWQQLFFADDVVGIKSNEWGPLPTPAEFENALRQRLTEVGIEEGNLAVDDRGVLSNPVFRRSTALINIRPMRTHHWAGVGGCLKNPITFNPQPWTYHDNYCANLARIFELPLVKGKVRLNILVMLTPLFHGIGPHHFDPEYTWPYNGIVVGTDPVAVDSVGLRILEAKRLEYFGESRPLKPIPHHIRFAETRHGLGVADPEKIDLVKIGWRDGILI
jgi:hypothetical protein